MLHIFYHPSVLLASLLAFQSFFSEISAGALLPNNRVFDEALYATIQISDQVTGDARNRASEKSLVPFGLTLSDEFEIGPQETLASMTKENYEKIKALAYLAKDAESRFNAAIEEKKSNPGDEAIVAKLKLGKRSNKCLKLLLQQVYISIDVAKGKTERAEKLQHELPKLKKNMEADAAKPGLEQISFLSMISNAQNSAAN